MAKDPRGGKRKGAGRKSGTASIRSTHRTRVVIAQLLASGKPTPLEVILTCMHDALDRAQHAKKPTEQTTNMKEAMHAAQLAAPYVHPKLQTTEHKGNLGLSATRPEDENALAHYERRLLQLKQNQLPTEEPIDVKAESITIKPGDTAGEAVR